MNRPSLLLRGLWHALGVAMIAVIALLTLSPSDSPLLVFSLWDKAMHFFGHAALSAWYALGVGRERVPTLLLAVVVFGVILELAQHCVPGRASELWDVVANSLGAIAGAALGLTPWRHGLAWVDRALVQRAGR
ncbi:MAG: VanZ family protein [Pseudomonadota bacterium]